MAVSGIVLPLQPLFANVASYGGKEIKVKKKLIVLMEQSLGESIDLSTFNWNGAYTDMGMDSLDWVVAIIETEKFYQISIPYDELNNLNTPQDLVNVVLKRAKKKDIK